MMISASFYRICNSPSSEGTYRFSGELILLKEYALKGTFALMANLQRSMIIWNRRTLEPNPNLILYCRGELHLDPIT